MEAVKQSEVQLNSDPEIDAFLRTANALTIQEILRNCSTNPGFNILCNEHENELWNYLLKRDYPSWGTSNNPREYYLRIAKINGIPYGNTSKYADIPGDKLLSQQERRPFLMMKVGDTDSFAIPDILARAYSGLLDALIDRNLTQGITDQDLWTVNIPIESLIVKTQGAEHALRKYFRAILSQNLHGHINYLFEIDVISITNLLQCRELLCDSLISVVEARMARLENELVQNNDVFQEEVDYLALEFAVAPGYVGSYLKSMSNLLYRTDNFTQEFVDYFKEIMQRIPNISVALLPSGYPFTKRNNIDRIDKDLFVINPFKQPVVSPDYLSADVVATLRKDPVDEQGREIRLWRAGPPPPIIEHYPTQEEVLNRMEVSFPTITDFIMGLQQKFKATFPRGEGGFILAGGMISMAFDDWMADPRSHWLLKTDADIFVYGWNIEYRMKAFDMIFNEMLDKFPSDPKTWETTFQYGVWQSVLTAEKKIYYDQDYKEVPFDQITLGMEENVPSAYRGRFVRSTAIQVINTNSKNGFEVIMNFDTSHIQIGWDCHKEWMATPYWELYFPRRESLLVRYNIRSHRLAKTLFKGFTLKTLMPYSLILTPKGIGYSHVLRPENIIEIIPDYRNTYADDLRLIGNGRSVLRLDHVSGQYVNHDTGEKGDIHFRSEPQQDVLHILIYTEGRIQKIVIAAHTGNTDEPATAQYGGSGTKEQLLKLREQIKFDGQFKNGFDAYVRERYLTYDLNHIDLRKVSLAKTGIAKNVDVDKLTLEQIIGEIAILPDTRFVMRDCKILFDPREKSVDYDPTNKFAFSLRSDILRKIKEMEFGPMYMGDDPEKRGLAFSKLREKGLFDGDHARYRPKPNPGQKVPDNEGQNVPLETRVIADDSDQTRESQVISNNTDANKYIIRSLFCFPVEVEGIIQLKIDPSKKNAGLNEELNPKLGGVDVTYMESLPKEILQGMVESNTIKGRDLISLCNSSPKLRETCLQSKNLVDKSGKVYDVQTQYVYRKALEELGIPIPAGLEPADVYGRFLNSYRYYALDHLLGGENGYRKYRKHLLTYSSQLIRYTEMNLPIVTIEQIKDHNLKINLIPGQPDIVRVLVDEAKDFSVDNTDLHDRFYSDEEREQLPLFNHRQWQEIRVGKLKLPADVTAIRVRTPAIVQESLFLNADDWTMPVEEVLARRNELMFNCLCYQDMTTTVHADGSLERGSISIFRAFMIY